MVIKITYEIVVMKNELTFIDWNAIISKWKQYK